MHIDIAIDRGASEAIVAQLTALKHASTPAPVLCNTDACTNAGTSPGPTPAPTLVCQPALSPAYTPVPIPSPSSAYFCRHLFQQFNACSNTSFRYCHRQSCRRRPETSSSTHAQQQITLLPWPVHVCTSVWRLIVAVVWTIRESLHETCRARSTLVHLCFLLWK